MTPKITLCNKELFEKRVVEIFDPIHNQRYWFVRCKTGREFSKILTEVIPGYTDLVEDSESDELAGGECVDLVIDGRMIVVFWCDPTDINALVHESLHAILFSVKSRGISRDDDESLCYMLGFLVEEVTTKMNVRLRKERKASKPKTQLHFSEGSQQQ